MRLATREAACLRTLVGGVVDECGDLSELRHGVLNDLAAVRLPKRAQNA